MGPILDGYIGWIRVYIGIKADRSGVYNDNISSASVGKGLVVDVWGFLPKLKSINCLI